MQRAWQQVQKVYEANRTIRGFQFILQVCARYTSSSSSKLPPAQLLAVTSASARQGARQPDDDPAAAARAARCARRCSAARSVGSRVRPASSRSGSSADGTPLQLWRRSSTR